MPEEIKNPAGEVLWKVTELSHYLNCTDRTIYGWIQSGRIPTVKIGKLRRIRESVVRELVKDDAGATHPHELP